MIVPVVVSLLLLGTVQASKRAETVDVFTINIGSTKRTHAAATHHGSATTHGVSGTVNPTGIVCGSKPADVVFILDSSGSEGSVNFGKQLDFVKNFAKELTIGPNNVQIGVIKFDSRVENAFWLNTHKTKASLLPAIQKIRYMGGGTSTYLALNFAKTNAFTPQHGHRSNAVKVVIVITDGNSVDHPKTSQAATQLHASGVEVIAIGIGNAINNNELSAIASKPSYMFRVANFNALHTIEKTIIHTTCTIAVSVCKTKPVDIVFLLDSSSSEGPTNFQKQLDFVKKFVDNFLISPQNVHIGLVTFSTSVKNQFFLTAHTNATALKTAIGHVKYVTGSTHTGDGLNYIRQNQLSAQHGARNGVDKVVIVLTDGNSQNTAQTTTQANLLHKVAKVIAIGIGSNIRQSELNHIASDHQHVFQVANFNALHTIEQELANKTCTTTYRTTVVSPIG